MAVLMHNAFLVLLLLGITCGCGKAQDHAVAKARMDLASVAQAFVTLSLSRPEAIPRSALSNMNSRALYSILCTTNGGVKLLDQPYSWDLSHDILDPWGQPVQVQTKILPADTNSFGRAVVVRVRLWSIGPNGRNENGTGDDIVSEPFMIEVPK
jgi:hypothetical protein